MQEQLVKNRTVQKSVTLWVDQLARIEKLIPGDRSRQLSRFIQVAIDEKLDRIEADKDLSERQKAS